MPHAAIWIGLFILFSVAFVGGLGRPLYTYGACVSGVALTLAGLASMKPRLASPAAPWLIDVAGLAYLPVIYQRFAFNWGPDWVGLALDMAYFVFLAFFLRSRWTRGARADMRKEFES